jgi:anti-anti-sigma regulatory factor
VIGALTEVVDLRGVHDADDEGLEVLRDLHRDFRVDGGELLMRG